MENSFETGHVSILIYDHFVSIKIQTFCICKYKIDQTSETPRQGSFLKLFLPYYAL